ncbi:hypothetical protein DSO57_1033333 [Entomophthora muscae]|uniref:Uncharacterized protein n=1 Tax=Entomophthora muscae TaxID=34485 RepID=A0ACC2UK76_9FUNG|nr:hypothetical protein DSO57_1033333 [Entomophthora muscae]
MMDETAYLPADEGYAWVICLASFVMQACAVGVISGMGVFMEHYTNNVFPTEKKSKVAMIVNLAPVVLGVGSLVTGRVCQRFGVRVCVVLGAFTMMSGLVLASFGTQVWRFALSQGVMVGFGAALIFVPANVAIAEWFEKRRGLAAGLGAAGGGIGGAAFAQLNSCILPVVGLRYTLQINGGVVLVVLLLSAAMVRRRESKASTECEETRFDKSLVLNGKFGFFAVASFFGGAAYFIPLYYINNHAVLLGMNKQEAGVVGSTINIGSAIGRVSMGFLGDYIGYVNCYILAIALSALTSIIWRFSTSFTMLIVFGILYGIPSGGYAGGFGPTCAAIFGKRQLATMMGLVYSFGGVGELVGPILCGFLIDTFNNYSLIIYFTIICYATTCLAMIVANVFVIRAPPHGI